VADALRESGERARAVGLLDRNEAVLAKVRTPDDPELAWLRAKLARLHDETSAGPEDRNRARAALAQACAVLEAHAAYRAEASEARAWLDVLAR